MALVSEQADDRIGCMPDKIPLTVQTTNSYQDSRSQRPSSADLTVHELHEGPMSALRAVRPAQVNSLGMLQPEQAALCQLGSQLMFALQPPRVRSQRRCMPLWFRCYEAAGPQVSSSEYGSWTPPARSLRVMFTPPRLKLLRRCASHRNIPAEHGLKCRLLCCLQRMVCLLYAGRAPCMSLAEGGGGGGMDRLYPVRTTNSAKQRRTQACKYAARCNARK